MRATHRQIADRVGISRSKVTEVLHGTRGSRVSAVTRRKIIKTAKELGYQPRNRTTYSIGYVFSVENLELEAETMFLLYVQRALREEGYRLTLSDFDPSAPKLLQNVLNPKTVDGVIFTNWYEGKIKGLLAPEIPWVLASDEEGIPDNVDMVALDAVQSAMNITNVLLGAGHRRICLIIGAKDIKYHWQIKLGVRAAIEAAGLSNTALRIIEIATNKDIAEQLQAAMRATNSPTAVLTTNPSQAVPALHALNAHARQVPRDVSLASVADSRQFEVLQPPITAGTALGQDLARSVVKRLLQKIQDPQIPPRQTLVPAEVVIRESVALKTKRVDRTKEKR